MPIVAMPDGTQVSFPDDMPKEQIAGLIASKFPQVAPKSGDAEAGLIGKATQGLTVGLGDELQAALASGIGGTAQRAASGLGMDVKPQPYGDIYERNLSQARGDLSAAGKEYPKASIAAEVAGGIAPALAGYGLAGNLGLTTAKTALGRRGKESLLGAIGSGVYGFNTGEGEDRTKSAIKNAATGAILSPIAGSVLERVARPISAAYGKITSQPAPNQLAEQLKQAIEAGDAKTRDTLLAQINAGKAQLPFEVPMSKGNLVPTLQNQDIEERALKGALGNEPLRIMQDFTTKQNQAIRSNISALIRDNDLPANAVGDDIVDAVTKAYQSAKGAKTAAYNTAKPLMENAYVFKNSLVKFGKEMDEALMDYPSDVAAKIRKEFDTEIARAGNATNIPFSRIEAFRKKMNNLGAYGTPESAAGGAIKSRLDSFIDNGALTGDKGAVAAITEARKLSSQLKRTYQTNQASPVVREIVTAVDNNAMIAPEKIFQAISTGNSKQNANNVSSLVKILGQEHPTVQGLRDSILKDVRDRATDASGFVSPAKLAGNIDNLIYKNKSVAGQLLSENEIKTLKALQDVSRKIAYKAPGVVNNSNTANALVRQLDALSRSFVGRNTPFFGSLVNSLKESSAANVVGKATQQTIEAKPILGGALEAAKPLSIRVYKKAGE